MKSIQDFSNQIDRLKTALSDAEAVVIGAGAGLSTSAGYTYSEKRFTENFSDFEKKYGFHDMYSGGFFPFETQEEFWAFWSRNIFLNRFQAPPKPVYEELYNLVKDKNYFVITTNVDHCFQRAGFDKKRLFYTQGDYGLFQCSVPCHKKTYDNEDVVKKMVTKQWDMKVPSQLVPKCPKCGKPMALNLRCDDKFVEDNGWRTACKNYEKFIENNRDKKILFLELGVGFNTPAIIKFPFMKMTAKFSKAFYACVNYGEAYIPDEISDRAVAINCDIAKVLESLKQE